MHSNSTLDVELSEQEGVILETGPTEPMEPTIIGFRDTAAETRITLHQGRNGMGVNTGAAVRRIEEKNLSPGTVRLNLALPEGTRERIERLQEATGARSVTSVIANALRLYEWYVDQKDRGREVLVQTPGKDPVIVEILLG